MGTLAGSMREAYVKKFGEKKWKGHLQVINEMWEAIRKQVRELRLPYQRVKVYQDGLPICGKEREIIMDLAKQGSPNHLLVQWMMNRGATLVGTEDPRLLLGEYNFIKKITQAKTHREHERFVHAYEKASTALLRKRDEKIRDQIVATLKAGETGVLFIGLLHRVDELLPGDIQASYLIHRLPFRRSFEMEMAS